MKMQRITVTSALAILALCLAGCSQAPPILEEKAAEQAIDAARPLGEKYAPDQFKQALSTFDEAKLEIETQVAAGGYSQSFNKAKELMVQAKDQAEQAQQVAQQNQARARGEAEAGLADLDTGITAVHEKLLGVRKTKANKAAREQMAIEVVELQELLDEARLLVSDETYLETIEKVNQIKEKLALVQTAVDELAG